MIFNANEPVHEKFVQTMDDKLEKYECFEKSFCVRFDCEVTTYMCSYKKFIIDVIDEECCLTTKSENIVYNFYQDDFENVIDEIIDKFEHDKSK